LEKGRKGGGAERTSTNQKDTTWVEMRFRQKQTKEEHTKQYTKESKCRSHLSILGLSGKFQMRNKDQMHRGKRGTWGGGSKEVGQKQ